MKKARIFSGRVYRDRRRCLSISEWQLGQVVQEVVKGESPTAYPYSLEFLLVL